MSSITVNTLVLGSLTVAVDGSDSTLALSVLGTAPANLTIEIGTPGAQGDAATIAVGTTTTLSPGASATVANVGTSSAAVFNFGIPQGEVGATGPQGSQGPAGTAATIAVGTVTTGSAGSSASITNVGTSSAAVFDFTIPRGDKGETGNTGATGATGSPGTAATIAVGTTTTLSPGSSATVTNAGTSGAAVFDFGIPAGQTGATGATGATGPAGPGVATGGTTGMALLKVDGTDYNTTWGTPALASHAETTQATVHNSTGSTLTPGQIVYINGALGNRPTVALSQANSEATSAGTYAMVEASIPNNTDGTVITSGTVMNLDTSALADGDKLYLSPTTAGAWTTTKPSAPNHLVYIGTVTRAHPTLGTIQLRIQNGYELDELHDVAIASKTNNDLLAYESATSLWKNKSFSTLDLLTATTASSTYLAKASNLSDLASASTARTNLGLGTAAVEPASKLVPTGGTTGQVLAKNSATNWDLAWTTVSGDGGADLQIFGSSTSSGTFTWTKPANAKTILLVMFGGGGGGGSGARQATSSGRSGGSGASGGGYFINILSASEVASTVTVTVGAGGAGGAARTTDNSNGFNGSTGGNSTFGNYQAGIGYNGLGGLTSTISQVSNGYYSIWGILGGTLPATLGPGQIGVSSPNGSNTAYNLFFAPTGGGGGNGQAASTTTTTIGGNSGGHTAAANIVLSTIINAYAGATGGNPNTSTPSGNGTAGAYNVGGCGGGGGGYKTATAGQAGGNGGWPGGGGGGGGASDNGFASGAGGTGANGLVYVLTFC